MKILYLKVFSRTYINQLHFLILSSYCYFQYFKNNWSFANSIFNKETRQWYRSIFDRFYCFQLALQLYAARAHLTSSSYEKFANLYLTTLGSTASEGRVEDCAPVPADTLDAWPG
jgi:hypothetical protein